MNKKLKRIMATITCMATAFSLFTGCGGAERATDGGNHSDGTDNSVQEVVFFDIDNPQNEISAYSTTLGGSSAASKIVLRNQEKNTMPIGGFMGPSSKYLINGRRYDLLTDETFGALKECGINMIVNANETMLYGSEIATKTLTLADRYGINYFMNDSTVNIAYNSQSTPYTDASSVGTKDEIKAAVSAYARDYKYFSGFIGADEPAEASFGSITTAWTNFNAAVSETDYADSGLTLYFNHIGATADDRRTSSTYEQYLNKYLATGGNYLMFDIYPFGGTSWFYSDWLNVLGLYAALSTENNVPWWGYAQAGGNFGGSGTERITTEGEMNYNVNTMIAFGAKGISYFPCCQPLYWITDCPGYNTNDAGLINEYGQKTPRYYYVKQINRQLLACDEYLMDCDFKGVIQTATSAGSSGNNPAIYSGKPYGRSVSKFKLTSYGILSSVSKASGDNAIVGCFDYGDCNAYYVVNDSYTDDDAKITLNFNGNYDYLIIQRGVAGTLSAKKSFGVRLAAGEAAFVLQLKNTQPNENDNDIEDGLEF